MKKQTSRQLLLTMLIISCCVFIFIDRCNEKFQRHNEMREQKQVSEFVDEGADKFAPEEVDKTEEAVDIDPRNLTLSSILS